MSDESYTRSEVNQLVRFAVVDAMNAETPDRRTLEEWAEELEREGAFVVVKGGLQPAAPVIRRIIEARKESG